MFSLRVRIILCFLILQVNIILACNKFNKLLRDQMDLQSLLINQIKGTMRNRTVIRYTDEEIMADLEEQYKVKMSSIYRMKRKVCSGNDTTLEATGTFVLTFQSAYLPDKIAPGWNTLEVRKIYHHHECVLEARNTGLEGKTVGRTSRSA